jgi:hypothetical protein
MSHKVIRRPERDRAARGSSDQDRLSSFADRKGRVDEGCLHMMWTQVH